MSDKTDDEGTIQALLERLVKVRLPRAIEIKTRIDGGQRLGDNDLEVVDAQAIDRRGSKERCGASRDAERRDSSVWRTGRALRRQQYRWGAARCRQLLLS